MYNIKKKIGRERDGSAKVSEYCNKGILLQVSASNV